MKSPFKFGSVVEGEYFTNRVKDIDRLILNFESNINTILLSPRRWGKSSLVKKAVKSILKKESSYRACYIDLFQIRDENEFYSKFATEIIKSTSTKMEEWIKTSGKFLKNFKPNISFGVDPNTDFKISIDFAEEDKTYAEILELPEKIAKSKKIKIIVCIDEFQNLSNFEDPILFQKRLRSVWQHHKKSVYCLFGSKRHMLMDIFENKSMPFYKFGDVFYLEKIRKHYLTRYLIAKFTKTKKDISVKHADHIVQLMDEHPYYVQQLSHIVWSNTEKDVTEKIITYSVNQLLEQNSLLFEKEIDSLSNTQINFLRAIILGVENSFSSQVILRKYKLGASSNIVKIKRALVQKEIINIGNGKPIILDPCFLLWLKEKYFFN